MSAHRFFLTSALSPDGGDALPLSEADAHHAADVVRLRVGEQIDVVEPDGTAWRLRVVDVTRRGVRAARVCRLESAALPSVTLVQGVAKGDKMDDIVRHAVEVGAEAVLPVISARSIVQLDAKKRVQKGERWRRIAESAAKQSRRTSVPAVSDPVRLREALGELSGFDAVIVLWEECAGARLSKVARRVAREGREPASPGGPRVALVVGPEGGLAAEEVAELEALGAVVASLGPTILRAETAAVVALALAIDALSEPRGE